MVNNMIELLPVVAIIPTANRNEVLSRTLHSLAKQQKQPVKIVIVDASVNDLTRLLCESGIPGLNAELSYHRADVAGAAAQRNQGMRYCEKDFVLFLDDDIILEDECIGQLWTCMQSDPRIAGVNAMVTNQRYHSPGTLTRFMYRLMDGQDRPTYAGKCIGPAWNLLPEDKPSGSSCNSMEWLNTTCTLYRKAALPSPVFHPHFKGYSLMEDLALSLEVAKHFNLVNARNARIFHDSQPGNHKADIKKIARMELINRQFIMTQIMGRTGFLNHAKLFVFECWGIVTSLGNAAGWQKLLPVLAGKFSAICTLMFTKTSVK
jgi:GT2 family glycosyltransferase